MSHDPPIDAILFSLLNTHSSILAEEICWWDSARAEAAIQRAGMVRLDVGNLWVHGPETFIWFQETFDAIRSARPNDIAGGYSYRHEKPRDQDFAPTEALGATAADGQDQTSLENAVD